MVTIGVVTIGVVTIGVVAIGVVTTGVANMTTLYFWFNRHGWQSAAKADITPPSLG
jgi:hypothetical protein